MATLDSGLRNALDATIGRARDEAERAAARALTTLGINQSDSPRHLSDEQRTLWRQLRAKGRQLGDRERLDAREPLSRAWSLVGECAYEHWHRMLFARFLAENGLLIYPDAGVAVSLADCAQIAAESGVADPWTLVAEYAAQMLPGIFRADDPLLHVPLAAEGRQALERLLEGIPTAVFTSEDGLGWVYQFWQSKRKAEVNASGVKIGGADIAPVTQLFTEPYMVQFLLHNTLGAWWAARHPDDPLVAELTYLRRLDDGTPAAGTFDGWPPRAAEVTIMDPCCGSGHFLVAAFDLLRRMREREEDLTPAEACVATVRDNIYGLEIDARCTQIAAFALALAAWKAAGYQELPVLHVACSGIPVGGRLYEWTSLAHGNTVLAENLRRLYQLFIDASNLGSLIDPTQEIGIGLLGTDPEQTVKQLSQSLDEQDLVKDETAAIFGQAAFSAMRSARLLSISYTLVLTNVPYLALNKQDLTLRTFCDTRHPDAKRDLATVFLERCRSFASAGGSYALVTPQYWLFLSAYSKFRTRLLREQQFDCIARLGANAFETISGEVVNVALNILTNIRPTLQHSLNAFDVSAMRKSSEKAIQLHTTAVISISQNIQLRNPEAMISIGSESGKELRRLGDIVFSAKGICTGDYPRFGRQFWEIATIEKGWQLQRTAVTKTQPYGGCENILFWEEGKGEFYRFVRERLGGNTGAWIRGAEAWNKSGIAVSRMSALPSTLYTGELFDDNSAVLIPHNPLHLPAVWAFCSSMEFRDAVRDINQKLSVDNTYLKAIPFDLARWQAVADAAGPLPEPYSDGPTQWLFHGDPARATAPLQVALARLLGYRWPQNEEDGLRRFADEDGVVCLDAVAGEPPAAERLRAILAAAWGERWSPAVQERLLSEVSFGGKGLDAWLRDGAGFFKQHCALFHNRPFLWQIWDGRKDGFSAIVNYHALDGRKLDRLIYSYLGAWINQQRADADAGVTGADLRLGAAQALQKKLVAIREGEPTYDIYVRWKSADKQPLGWEPDLNDGMRLNVRPFVSAGVLRAKFTVNWNKDRGSNPDGSERLNDLHLTRAEREAARGGATVTPWATEAERASGAGRR